MEKNTMTKSELRKALKDFYGTRQYRIDGNNDVHAHGNYPNSIETGWYLVGDANKMMSKTIDLQGYPMQ